MKYRAKWDSARGQPKVVYVLSTSHGAAMKDTNRVDTDGNIIQKPTSIIDYNHNMGGTDLVDQQLDSLNVLRKSYKLYKKTLSLAGYAMCIDFSQIVQETRREG